MKTKLLFLLALTLTSYYSFAQQSGEVIITEIHNRPQKPTALQVTDAIEAQPTYWDPGNSVNSNQTDNDEGDEDHTEWFEVYNTTASPVVMDGWTIQDASKSSAQTVIGTFTLAANSFAVFSGYNIPEAQGGIVFDYFYDYEKPSFSNESSFSDPGDKSCPDGVILLKPDGTIADAVRYDYGYGEYIDNPESGSCKDNATAIGIPPQNAGSKKSMQLDNNFLNATDNDNAEYWSFSTKVYDADNNQLGSPGTENETNPDLSTIKFDSNAFALFPNPAKDYITINSKNNIKIASIAIYDVVGKSVFAQEKFESNKINVSQLNEGVYFLKIEADKNSVIKKIIID